MTISDLYTPVLTLLGIAITAFFSSEGWKYYQKKLERKHKDEEFKRQEEHLYREDLRARVSNLEAILTESMKEKSEMMTTIIHLTSQVSKLEVQVKYLEKENDILSRTR